MSTVQKRPKLEFSEFEKNRQRFTDDELQPYQGKWVGFSLDGCRIVAGATTLEELKEEVERAGDNISNVALEFIDLENECFMGGSETI
jgi:hypothetical protein